MFDEGISCLHTPADIPRGSVGTDRLDRLSSFGCFLRKLGPGPGCATMCELTSGYAAAYVVVYTSGIVAKSYIASP